MTPDIAAALEYSIAMTATITIIALALWQALR